MVLDCYWFISKVFRRVFTRLQATTSIGVNVSLEQERQCSPLTVLVALQLVDQG